MLGLCFLDSRLLENTNFLQGDDKNPTIISCFSLQIKIRTWSIQLEGNPV